MDRLAIRRLIGVLAVLALVLPVLGAPAAADEPTDLAVVVQADEPAAAAAAVVAVGGVVDRSLPLIGGVAATIPDDALAALNARPGVAAVVDEVLTVASAGFADAPDVAGQRAQLAAMHPPTGWGDTIDGLGVGVAVLDTGIDATHPELADRVVHTVNLSGDADAGDGYGHGTFMAGLIAGRTTGIAPGAHLVSVKVADAEGTTSMSRVIEGIGWVVTNADTYALHVLNLSLAAPPRVAPPADPLAAAAEAAWSAGIVVVVAAGNDGAGNLGSPGHDPWVITVGAVDAAGTVPTWSATGRFGRVHKPDVLAPGVSTVSLRAAGSAIDRAHGEQAAIGAHHFRGSGTSMSTALVSGAAALLLETHPLATPDDVKGALVDTSRPVAGSRAGTVDLAAADAAAPNPRWTQQHPIAFGNLDGMVGPRMPWAERGAPGPSHTWQRVRWLDGMSPARTAFAADPTLTRVRWLESEWSRVRWLEADWSRVRWLESEWSRVRWLNTAEWSRVRWLDTDWSRVRWLDTEWSRVRWLDTEWSRVRWLAAWDAATTP